MGHHHRTFTLLLLDLPRFCAVQIRLLAVQQQARLLVIVFVFVLCDAVFDLFPRGTIWTRASVVTSRVRRRFDVLLTVFPPLVPVVVADHGVGGASKREPRSSLPLRRLNSSFSKRRRCTRCCCCCSYYRVLMFPLSFSSFFCGEKRGQKAKKEATKVKKIRSIWENERTFFSSSVHSFPKSSTSNFLFFG